MAFRSAKNLVSEVVHGRWRQDHSTAGEDDNNTYCKLAARINAIEKFVFVNRQGVMVVE